MPVVGCFFSCRLSWGVPALPVSPTRAVTAAGALAQNLLQKAVLEASAEHSE